MADQLRPEIIDALAECDRVDAEFREAQERYHEEFTRTRDLLGSLSPTRAEYAAILEVQG